MKLFAMVCFLGAIVLGFGYLDERSPLREMISPQVVVTGVGCLCLFGFLMRMKSRKRKPEVELLDVPLMHWSKDDPYTVRDLLNGGVAVFGRSGSGKTSGSGKRLMRAIVEYGNAGGLILAAKPEDADDVRELFRRAGRADDLLVVNQDGELRCNFIDYVRHMGGDTREITKFVMTVGESLRSSDNKGGGENADFFEQENSRLLYNAIECVHLGTGKVSAPDLQKFITSAATDPANMTTALWKAGLHNKVMEKAWHAQKSAMQKHDFELATDYWFKEWPNMGSRTRSSIQTGVMSILHVANTGLVRQITSGDTNVSPDDIMQGRWILVNLPPAKYGDAGRYVCGGFKYLTQLAMMRRKAVETDPICVIWADEFQNFVSSMDWRYLAECRSHRGAMVVLTQSLHSIFQAMPGQSGKDRAQALMTNFSTKVFHALGSATDGEYASSLIGKALQITIGGSTPPSEDLFSAMAGLTQSTSTFNEGMRAIIEPNVFLNNLRTGGKQNGYLVDAIVIKSGEPFADGANFKFVSFNQKG